MSNNYPIFVPSNTVGGYFQPIVSGYDPQLAAMANFNQSYTIQKNFVKNNNEIYEFQSLQNAIRELEQFPIVAFTFPCQNISIDTVIWNSSSFMCLKPTVSWLISETQLSVATPEYYVYYQLCLWHLAAKQE